MRYVLAACAMIMLLTGGALATQEADQGDAFDEAVRQFGYVSGLAHQCVPEDKQGEVERATLKAFPGLVRLFGSDQAFLYAAAFGAGSTAEFDKAECAMHLSVFEEQLKKNMPTQ